MTESPRQHVDLGSEGILSAVQRVKAEFNEMPGLTLTVHQAARLWALDLTFCAAILAALEDAKFLVRIHNEVFARAE